MYLFTNQPKKSSFIIPQGRIREEVVYGICMPVPGFSVLFVVVAVSAVVSALVAGTLLYRYQLQKEQLAEQPPVQMGLWRLWRGKMPVKRRGVVGVVNGKSGD